MFFPLHFTDLLVDYKHAYPYNRLVNDFSVEGAVPQEESKASTDYLLDLGLIPGTEEFNFVQHYLLEQASYYRQRAQTPQEVVAKGLETMILEGKRDMSASSVGLDDDGILRIDETHVLTNVPAGISYVLKKVIGIERVPIPHYQTSETQTTENEPDTHFVGSETDNYFISRSPGSEMLDFRFGINAKTHQFGYVPHSMRVPHSEIREIRTLRGIGVAKSS